jgi:hypothetical protein
VIRTRRRTRDDARDILDQAVAELLRCQREGTGAVYVTDVLALLGAGPAPPPPQAPPRDPQADPMTGAMWAGAPGTLPP